MKQLSKLAWAACRKSAWFIVLMSAAVHAFAVAPQTALLKPVAQVSLDTVTLGDVVAAPQPELPVDLVLCRAPEFGSVRVLDAAGIAAILKKYGVRISLRGAQQVSILRTGRPVSAGELRPLIEAAFKKEGSRAALSDVRLQSRVILAPDATVQLIKLKFDANIGIYRAWFVAKRSTARIAFEALVTIQPGSAPLDMSVSAVPKRNVSKEALLIRHGQTAAMELQGNGFSATVPVLCLEDGWQSTLIQVRDVRTKVNYRAEVTGPGQLRRVETLSGPGTPNM